MSQNSLGDIRLDKYKGKQITVEKSRLRNDAPNADIVKELLDLRELVRDLASEQQNFIKHYNDDNVYKTNKLKPAVERTTKASGDTIITSINNGTIGASSSTTGSTVKTQTIALTAGVAVTVTFEEPSEIVQYPLCFATQDGIYTMVGYTPTYTSLPVSFSITAISDCTMYVSYKYL